LSEKLTQKWDGQQDERPLVITTRVKQLEEFLKHIDIAATETVKEEMTQHYLQFDEQLHMNKETVPLIMSKYPTRPRPMEHSDNAASESDAGEVYSKSWLHEPRKPSKPKRHAPPPPRIHRNITDPNKIIKAVVTPPAPYRPPHAAIPEGQRTSPTPRRRMDNDIQGDDALVEDEDEDEGWVKAPPPAEPPQTVKAIRAASGLGIAMRRSDQFQPSQATTRQGPALQRRIRRSATRHPQTTSQRFLHIQRGPTDFAPAENSESTEPTFPVESNQSSTGGDFGGSGERRGQVADTQQMRPASVRSQEEIQFIPELGVKIRTAVYPLPEGHGLQWDRDACRPVQVAEPPEAFFLRAMVPVSFKDSALNPREKAIVYNDRLTEMETFGGLSGRYSSDRPFEIKHRNGGGSGSKGTRQFWRTNHDRPPLVIQDERSRRTTDRGADDHPRPSRFPIPTVRQGMIFLESVPRTVSLVDIMHCLDNTGRIHSIETGTNNKGRFVAIRFACMETAKRIARYQQLAVSSSEDQSTVGLPIRLETEATANALDENVTRTLTVGPCPKEYYVAGYVEHAGGDAASKDSPLDGIWEILEEKPQTIPIDACVRSCGRMLKARLNFRSIAAASEARRDLKKLEAFQRVRIDHSRDP